MKFRIYCTIPCDVHCERIDLMLIVVEMFSVVDAALILVEVVDDPCQMRPFPCSGHGNCYSSSENPDGDHCVCESRYFGRKCDQGMQSA